MSYCEVPVLGLKGKATAKLEHLRHFVPNRNLTSYEAQAKAKGLIALCNAMIDLSSNKLSYGNVMISTEDALFLGYGDS